MYVCAEHSRQETMTPDEGHTCTLVREGTGRMTKLSSVHQLKSSHLYHSRLTDRQS
jgi:hypothetical protein